MWPGYGLQNQQIMVPFQAKARDFLFSKTSRPPLGPNQDSHTSGTRNSLTGKKKWSRREANHSVQHLVSSLRISEVAFHFSSNNRMVLLKELSTLRTVKYIFYKYSFLEKSVYKRNLNFEAVRYLWFSCMKQTLRPSPRKFLNNVAILCHVFLTCLRILCTGCSGRRTAPLVT